MLNSKLKIQVKKLYISLLRKGFKIIKIRISGKYYYNYAYGNEMLLYNKQKRLYVYYTHEFSKYGIEKYEYFSRNKNIKKHLNISTNLESVSQNNFNIVISKLSSLSELRSIDVENLDSENLYVFCVKEFCEILCISDYLLLVESNYNEKISNIVDNFLDNGKEILVVPGDVWNRNCFFSNFLIKEGASVITNINDINLYL